MNGQLRPAVALSKLAQYGVIASNVLEATRASLYDTQTYLAAGQTNLSFFQTPNGSGGKTFADTNMSAAGMLSSPQYFLVESIEVSFFPTAALTATGAAATAAFLNDTNIFTRYNAWLEFSILNKFYVQEGPLGKFPPRNALRVAAAASDTTTAGANQKTIINYAAADGELYNFPDPLVIPPNTTFLVSLKWPAAVAISANAQVMVNLTGISYRAVQ